MFIAQLISCSLMKIVLTKLRKLNRHLTRPDRLYEESNISDGDQARTGLNKIK